MGNYSKTLTKRLRDRTPVNDPFWNCPPNLNFEKFCFNERWSRDDWCRIQASHGIGKIQANAHYDLYSSMEHWMNSDYRVILDKTCQAAIHKTFQGKPLWHLQIQRRDEKPFRDWQILQAIKNEIVGQEYEAIELYPAHSRLMDETNKYHLWILAPKDKEETPPRFPFGCRKYGSVSYVKIIVPEKVVQEHREELREAVLARPVEFRIFPESLRGEVEKEYPEVEYAEGVLRYARNHPELELQLFEP